MSGYRSPTEILEKQRLEYVESITAFLDSNQSKVNIWNVLKEDAGYGDTPISELPLEVLRSLFITLTVD